VHSAGLLLTPKIMKIRISKDTYNKLKIRAYKERLPLSETVLLLLAQKKAVEIQNTSHNNYQLIDLCETAHQRIKQIKEEQGASNLSVVIAALLE
jgi:predicted CopG family antitoxin